MSGLRAWWDGRTARERWMLRGLAVVLALFVGWYGVAAPLIAFREAARAHRQEAARELAEMEAAVRALRERRAPATAGSLVAVVAASATAAGIVVTRHREEGDGRLTVWIEAVEPRRLMQWILLLRQSHGVGVDALAVSRADAGLEAELTLAH